MTRRSSSSSGRGTGARRPRPPGSTASTSCSGSRERPAAHGSGGWPPTSGSGSTATSPVSRCASSVAATARSRTWTSRSFRLTPDAVRPGRGPAGGRRRGRMDLSRLGWRGARRSRVAGTAAPQRFAAVRRMTESWRARTRVPLLGELGVVSGLELAGPAVPVHPHAPDEHLEGRLAGVLVLRHVGARDERDEGLAEGVVATAAHRPGGPARGVRARLLQQVVGERGQGRRLHGGPLRGSVRAGARSRRVERMSTPCPVPGVGKPAGAPRTTAPPEPRWTRPTARVDGATVTSAARHTVDEP